jgi:3-hydroxymyristoyl/3-hydroxydecanoyl-(acyl carrier protein) dehydratase
MDDGTTAAFESTHRIAADLRAFEGHFPGAPVLPGAYLLALVLHQLEQQPALRARLGATLQVQQVKFLAPVGPGHTLRLRLEARPQGIGFSLHRGATLVARGQLSGIEQAPMP